jgi:NHS family xanthosine MFS transporter
MMSNGFDAFFGSLVSGIVIDRYFMIDGDFDWQGVWLSSAGFAVTTSILFVVLFKSPKSETAYAS